MAFETGQQNVAFEPVPADGGKAFIAFDADAVPVGTGIALVLQAEPFALGERPSGVQALPGLGQAAKAGGQFRNGQRLREPFREIFEHALVVLPDHGWLPCGKITSIFSACRRCMPFSISTIPCAAGTASSSGCASITASARPAAFSNSPTPPPSSPSRCASSIATR